MSWLDNALNSLAAPFGGENLPSNTQLAGGTNTDLATPIAPQWGDLGFLDRHGGLDQLVSAYNPALGRVDMHPLLKALSTTKVATPNFAFSGPFANNRGRGYDMERLAQQLLAGSSAQPAAQSPVVTMPAPQQSLVARFLDMLGSTGRAATNPVGAAAGGATSRLVELMR